MKLYILLIFSGISMLSCAQNNIVKTLNGKIQGYTNVDQSISIYKGIPFAAPPVGELRWKAPQPVNDWDGIRDCTHFSASPIQNKPEPFMCWTEEFIAQPEPLSEDCLYLNIWTASKSIEKKKPVFVWIYGGGLTSGSANCDIYDGEEMAKQGVVFVSINYRVGVLGFMAHPELSKESENNTSGNYGILDQIAALKWIQANISKFGGDANNVTIAGQSAGAFSVTALIGSPLAKGLFAKAIPQSGGILSNRLMNNLKTAEEKGLEFMKYTKSKSIAELRKISAAEIQEMSNKSPTGRFGITSDDYLLPQDIVGHFEKGNQNHVPILTGWVTGDGALFGSPNTTISEYQEEAQNEYGDHTQEFLQVFKAETDDEAKAMKMKMALFGFAGMPSHLLAGYNNQPTYLYQFTHVPPEKPDFPDYGAFHTSEVPYCLHTLHTWKRDWEDLDLKLENTISAYWVNFAKTGNPNEDQLPHWSTYDRNKGNIMELGDEVVLKKALFKKEFDFLEKVR